MANLYAEKFTIGYIYLDPGFPILYDFIYPFSFYTLVNLKTLIYPWKFFSVLFHFHVSMPISARNLHVNVLFTAS